MPSGEKQVPALHNGARARIVYSSLIRIVTAPSRISDNTIQAPDLTAVGEFCGDDRAQQARSHDDCHGQRKELRAQRDVADGAGQRDERHNHRAGADGDGA